MTPPTRRIALIYDARLTYDLKVMTGVAAYLQEGHHYSVYIEESALKDQRLPDLRTWAGDGIIADFDDPAVARLVMQSRLPAVAFGGGYGWYEKGSPIPYFYASNQGVARLAADHLLDRGFRHFAFCGYARTAINYINEPICSAGVDAVICEHSVRICEAFVSARENVNGRVDL